MHYLEQVMGKGGRRDLRTVSWQRLGMVLLQHKVVYEKPWKVTWCSTPHRFPSCKRQQWLGVPRRAAPVGGDGGRGTGRRSGAATVRARYPRGEQPRPWVGTPVAFRPATPFSWRGTEQSRRPHARPRLLLAATGTAARLPDARAGGHPWPLTVLLLLLSGGGGLGFSPGRRRSRGERGARRRL
jgi:hypothetical protein